MAVHVVLGQDRTGYVTW